MEDRLLKGQCDGGSVVGGSVLVTVCCWPEVCRRMALSRGPRPPAFIGLSATSVRSLKIPVNEALSN
jgi:hypothetical protein